MSSSLVSFGASIRIPEAWNPIPLQTASFPMIMLQKSYSTLVFVEGMITPNFIRCSFASGKPPPISNATGERVPRPLARREDALRVARVHVRAPDQLARERALVAAPGVRRDDPVRERVAVPFAT